jgi:hypothetical protein
MLATHDWPTRADNMNSAPPYRGCPTTALLSLYIVPGKIPHDFFARYFENDRLDVKNKNTGTKFKNTLLVLIQKNIWEIP